MHKISDLYYYIHKTQTLSKSDLINLSQMVYTWAKFGWNDIT